MSRPFFNGVSRVVIPAFGGMTTSYDSGLPVPTAHDVKIHLLTSANVGRFPYMSSPTR